MKKFLVFILGVITGIVLTFLFAIVFNSKSASDDTVWFEAPGETIDEQCFEVFQVVDEGFALANGCGRGLVVYALVVEEGKYYYDEEVVRVPKNKTVRQVGIYKYLTKDSRIKTVPIVKMFDK